MQSIVYNYLKGANRLELFGDQVAANEFDEVERFNDRMLINATQLGLHDIVMETHRLGGLGIASHGDRPSYSILSQLGFIPPDLKLDALEISRNTWTSPRLNAAFRRWEKSLLLLFQTPASLMISVRCIHLFS